MYTINAPMNKNITIMTIQKRSRLFGASLRDANLSRLMVTSSIILIDPLTLATVFAPAGGTPWPAALAACCATVAALGAAAC